MFCWLKKYQRFSVTKQHVFRVKCYVPLLKHILQVTFRNWLVVSTPPQNMISSIGMIVPFPILMESHHKSHVPVTTNPYFSKFSDLLHAIDRGSSFAAPVTLELVELVEP